MILFHFTVIEPPASCLIIRPRKPLPVRRDTFYRWYTRAPTFVSRPSPVRSSLVTGLLDMTCVRLGEDFPPVLRWIAYWLSWQVALCYANLLRWTGPPRPELLIVVSLLSTFHFPSLSQVTLEHLSLSLSLSCYQPLYTMSVTYPCSSLSCYQPL